MDQPVITQYMRMMTELGNIRHKHKFNDSQEEQDHLDRMDAMWSSMSEYEKAIIDGIRCRSPLTEKY